MRCLNEFLTYSPADRGYRVREIFPVSIEELGLVGDRCSRFICKLYRYGIPCRNI